MAFCTQCGTRLPEAARFCPRCGVAAPLLDPPAGDTPTPDAATTVPTGRDGEGSPARAPVDPSFARTRDVPPEGLHFGPAPRPNQAGRAALPPPLSPAPSRSGVAGDEENDEGDDDGGTGSGTRMLIILALIAVAVLAVVFWQQRDGTRPVAQGATNASEPAPEPSDAPTDVASVPSPEPIPTPTPSPTVEVAQTGDEIGSPASLDPNGEAAIPAAAIDAAFADDADRAGEEFPGPVTVRGTVIGLLSDSPPTISLEGYRRGGIVVADLAGGQGDALQLLARGSVVRLRCGGVRYESGTTILSGCRI